MSEHAPRPLTVGEIIALYLPQAKRENAAATYDGKVWTLGRFAEAYGGRPVSTLRPFDLQKWLNDWSELKSEWTIRRTISVVKRCFNWALEMELIEKHPFARYRSRGHLTGGRKPMDDGHFQALMRFSPPAYRRLLIFLKFSGCRPGEASGMKWEDVRFDERCVVLKEHKTAHKTGKPRIIPLVATTIKMLAWMSRRRQTSVIGLMEKLLKNGPVKGVEMVRFMSHYGASDRATYIARQTMGVIRSRVGGTGPKGHYVYELPPDYVPSGQPALHEWVFTSCRGFPLNKSSLGCYMKRLRRRAGLPDGICLYQLRHRFGFQGTKNGVNLKLLSLAMGHSNTTMTEHYIASGGLMAEVQKAAVQVNYGAGAFEVEAPAIPRAVPSIMPPAAAEAQTEHLPKTFATRARPDVPKGLADVPLATFAADPEEPSVKDMLRLLMSRVSAPKPASPRRPTSNTAVLNPAHDQAYRAHAWAIERNQELAKALDREVYAWLLTQPDCPFTLPPTEITFGRYLTAARHFHGTLKRKLPKRRAMLRGTPLPAPLLLTHVKDDIGGKVEGKPRAGE